MATKSSKKESKAVATDGLSVLKDITETLFKQLGVTSGVAIDQDEANDSYSINVEGDKETGLLIGARGRTLSSIQTVLGLMYRQKTGDWKRIVLNVSDYREKEEERLRELANQSAERAKSTGEPQYLYNLNPSQRRIVHMALSEDPAIHTESQGEGQDRFLVVTAEK